MIGNQKERQLLLVQAEMSNSVVEGQRGSTLEEIAK
jgi:hypothetical protein